MSQSVYRQIAKLIREGRTDELAAYLAAKHLTLVYNPAHPNSPAVHRLH